VASEIKRLFDVLVLLAYTKEGDLCVRESEIYRNFQGSRFTFQTAVCSVLSMMQSWNMQAFPVHICSLQIRPMTSWKVPFMLLSLGVGCARSVTWFFFDGFRHHRFRAIEVIV
jgi:hypothetical protein